MAIWNSFVAMINLRDRFAVADTSNWRRQAVGSFAVRIAEAFLTFLAGVFFARLLGAEGFGAYSYAMSWSLVLASVAMIGGERLLVREIAVHEARQHWPLIRGLLQWMLGIATLVALLTALLSGVALLALRSWFPAEVWWALLPAIAIVPLTVMLRLSAAGLRGFRHVLSAQFPMMVFRPILSILILGLIWMTLPETLTPATAVGVQIVCVGMALLLSIFLLLRFLPSEVRIAEAEYHSDVWRRCLPALLVFSGMVMFDNQLDVLLVGSISGARDAGIFTVAKRAAMVVQFPLLAANFALGPVVAALQANGETRKMQSLLVRNARMVLLITLLISAALLATGGSLLLLFGPEFLASYVAMAILVGGYCLSATCGSAGMLTIMSGLDAAAAKSLGIAIVIKVALMLVLIPWLGIAGVAIAAAIGLFVWNVLLVRLSQLQLCVSPSVWPLGATEL